MNIIFTPAALFDLLNQIDELADYNIEMKEASDDKLQLIIGDSTYEISSEFTEEVKAPEEVIDAIEDINEEAYEDLAESGNFEVSPDVVESGIVKEAIKSLLLGGAIKLIKKLL